MHLEKGINALQNVDKQGAMANLSAAKTDYDWIFS